MKKKYYKYFTGAIIYNVSNHSQGAKVIQKKKNCFSKHLLVYLRSFVRIKNKEFSNFDKQ